jgi:hypothetical protein
MNEDGFDLFGMIIKIVIAFIISFIALLAWYLVQGGMLQPLMTSGAMNITQWNPLVAQMPTVVLPISLLFAFLILVFVVFFKKQVAENPYYVQMKQQIDATNRIQREQNRRKKPRRTVRY